MNSDDIRELNREAQEKCLETKTVAAHEAGLNSLAISFFTEIAAQLAELNESRKPKWVWLEHASGPCIVDVTQLVSLGVRSTRETYVYLRGTNDPWTIDMPIEVVADKLGIPPAN